MSFGHHAGCDGLKPRPPAARRPAPQIALRSSASDTGVEVVNRVLRAEGPKSSSLWTLNGSKATTEAVRAVFARFNISMGNMCQFLPQERISEFAGLSPTKLLRETERVFPSEGLHELHEEMIAMHRDKSTMGKRSEHAEKELALARDERESLESRVATAQERQREKKAVEELKRYLIYLTGVERRKELTDAIKAMDEQVAVQREAKGRRDEVRGRLEERLQSKTGFREAAAAQLKAVGKAAAARERRVDAAKEALLAYNSVHGRLFAAESRRERLQQMVETSEAKVKSLERTLGEHPSQEDLAAARKAANATLEEAAAELAEVRREQHEVRSRRSDAARDAEAAKRVAEDLKKRQMQSLQTIRSRFGRRERAAAVSGFADAILTGRRQNRFKGRVLLPACLELPVWGDDAEQLGAFLDTLMSDLQRTAVVCSHEEDKATVTQWRVFIQGGKAVMGTESGGPGAPLFGEAGASSSAAAAGGGKRPVGFGVTVYAVTDSTDPLASKLSDAESHEVLRNSAEGKAISARAAGRLPMRVTDHLVAAMGRACKTRTGEPMFCGSLYKELADRKCDPLLLRILVDFCGVTDTLVSYHPEAADAIKDDKLRGMLAMQTQMLCPGLRVSVSRGSATGGRLESFMTAVGIGDVARRLCFPRPSNEEVRAATERFKGLEAVLNDAVAAETGLAPRMAEATRAQDDATKAVGAAKAASTARHRSAAEAERARKKLRAERAELERDIGSHKQLLQVAALKAAADLADGLRAHSEAARLLEEQTGPYLATLAAAATRDDETTRLERALQALEVEVAQATDLASKLVDAQTTARALAKEAVARGREAVDTKSEEGAAFRERMKTSAPASPAELRDLIQTKAARLQVAATAGSEEAVLRRYEEAKAKESLLEAELAKLTGGMGDHDLALGKRERAFLRKMRHKVEAIDATFQESFGRMRCRGKVELTMPRDYSQWGLTIFVAYRKDEKVAPLSPSQHSGGERATATMMFLLALQATATVPFRVVDEVNQGMDGSNERAVFAEVQDQCRPSAEAAGADVKPAVASSSSAAAGAAAGDDGEEELPATGEIEIDDEDIVAPVPARHGCQYFVLSPKLLLDLAYEDHCRIHTVFSGAHVYAPEGHVDLRGRVRERLARLDSGASAEGGSRREGSEEDEDEAVRRSSKSRDRRRRSSAAGAAVRCAEETGLLALERRLEAGGMRLAAAPGSRPRAREEDEDGDEYGADACAWAESPGMRGAVSSPDCHASEVLAAMRAALAAHRRAGAAEPAEAEPEAAAVAAAAAAAGPRAAAAASGGPPEEDLVIASLAVRRARKRPADDDADAAAAAGAGLGRKRPVA